MLICTSDPLSFCIRLHYIMHAIVVMTTYFRHITTIHLKNYGLGGGEDYIAKLQKLGLFFSAGNFGAVLLIVCFQMITSL